MSLDDFPSLLQGTGRKGFVSYDGNVMFPATQGVVATTGNLQQVGGKSDMFQGLNRSGGLADIDVRFFEEQEAFVYEDNGYQVAPGDPGPGPFGPTGVVTWSTQVTNSIKLTSKFKFEVGQDANKNQSHVGAGVKIKNKLFSQTFTGEYIDLGSGPTFWTWTAGTPTVTDVELTLTATEVDWSANPDHVAIIECSTDYGPTTIWEAEYNYEIRSGWADTPPDESYYGTTATVTVKRLIGKDGTTPTYDNPYEAAVDVFDQVLFDGTEITPPQKAYT